MPAVKSTGNIDAGLGTALRGAAAVTPSDANELAYLSYLWVGNAGNIKVTMADGSIAVWTNFSGWLPGLVRQVWATDTTATGITAGWL